MTVASSATTTGVSPSRAVWESAQVLAVLAALLFTPGEIFADDAAPATAANRLRYNRDVRPILAETCFKCHGPDSAARKADLRLDRREAAVEAGAFEPGKPDESELVRRIFSDDPDERMPPPDSHKKLSEAQKQTLRRWIAQGAQYEPHWSLIPPQRPPLPEVKNIAWVRNPIDRFILARLEAAGLEPAPEADRRTLARRASLDLTGLPPSPQVVEQFLADPSPDAYEKFVDRLLDSEQWGEHRGRYWLDCARYADTHGIHFDNYREMWAYRDWVIKAFNRNMPYDEFTIENLAGDLLPGATLDQRVASGFNRCNITTNEGGIIDEEYLVLYTRDRTETTAHVWLGLTANCAVCHDHKFDPLTQREFYAMSAFFNNTTQKARDGNIKDTPPILPVPLPQDRQRWETLGRRLAEARGQLAERKKTARPEFDAWLATADPGKLATSAPSNGLLLHVPLDEGQGQVAHLEVDGQAREAPLTASAAWQDAEAAAHAVRIERGAICELPELGDFEGTQAFSCAAWVYLPANDGHGAIVARMDNQHGYRGWDFWVESRHVGMHIIHQWSGDAIKVVSAEQVPANQWAHVLVTYDGSQKAAGVHVYINGQPQKISVQADALRSTIRTTVPLKIGQRNTSEPLSGAALHDLRIYTRALTAAEAEALGKSTQFAAILTKPATERTAEEIDALYGWYLATRDAEHGELTAEITRLERERSELAARGTSALVMQERDQPAMAYVLFRGAYDKRRDPVEAGTPAMLPPLPDDFPRNRLGFARWLLLPQQPLTARVTVNRFWQQVFGTGIVRTAGDFGTTGEPPSHPDLLDWLAVDFREAGWDVKRLFKLMVISATYRQAATSTSEKLDADPDNRLLARGPRFRMDAEMVRDYALAASGLLVPKIGGPSVKPYQPPGVWEAIAMNVSNTRSYERDTGESLYRRSLYTFWKRQAPPALMDVLNAPNREFCVVRRERTNTPLQALATLNGEQFIEAARHLAEKALLEAGPAFEQRLNFVAARLLARPFRAEEAQVIRASFDELSAYYQSHTDDAAKLIAVGESKADPSLPPGELAAWTMLVNQLMNLDEVLNK